MTDPDPNRRGGQAPPMATPLKLMYQAYGIVFYSIKRTRQRLIWPNDTLLYIVGTKNCVLRLKCSKKKHRIEIVLTEQNYSFIPPQEHPQEHRQLVTKIT